MNPSSPLDLGSSSAPRLLLLRELQLGPVRPFHWGRLLSQRTPRHSYWAEDLEGFGFCCRFSGDGDRLCVASQGGVIRLYDCSDHSTERWRLSSQRIGNGVFWAIVDVDFAGNKEWLAYSSWSPKIQVVNVKSEAKTEIEMDTGSTRRSCLFGIRFSPDSKKILAGSSAGDLFLMDLETQELVVDKPGAHGDDLNSVAFISDNPEVFATAGDDRICKIWDQRCQDECVGVFVGHKLGLTCVSSRVDGRFLLTNGKDHCMKLWDMRQMSPANTRALSPSLPEHDYRFFQFQRPSEWDQERIPGDGSVVTFIGHQVQETLIRCGFSPSRTTGQRFVYSGCSSGRLFIYDILDGREISHVEAHDGILREADWHPNQMSIASTGVIFSIYFLQANLVPLLILTLYIFPLVSSGTAH